MKIKPLSLSIATIITASCLAAQTAYASSSTPLSYPMPYQELNVGQQYMIPGWHQYLPSYDNTSPIMSFINYLPNNPGVNGSSYSIVTTSAIANYFIIPKYSPSMYVNLPESSSQSSNTFLMSDFTALKNSGSCNTSVFSDPNKIVCNLVIQNDLTGAKSTLPIVVYAGLRANTIDQMLYPRYDRWMHTEDTSKPYYFEVSSQPKDFQGTQPTPIVNANVYFYIPQNAKPTYSFSGEYVAGAQFANQGVRYIVKSGNSWTATTVNTTTPNNVSNIGTTPTFVIDPNTGDISAQNLQAGIYQVNIKAATNNETAYQTFYVNVNPQNPSLSDWNNGAVASTNILGNYASIYEYSTGSPNTAQSQQMMQNYATDLKTENESNLKSEPIKTIQVQIMTQGYAGSPTDPNSSDFGGGYWPVNANAANPIEAIQPNQAQSNYNMQQLNSFLESDVVQPFASKGMTVTLASVFSNTLKTDFITLNSKQQKIIANMIAQPAIQFKNVSGIGFDLEGGFNQPSAVAFYKKLTDTLAYHGKWMTYFAFSDMIDPTVVAALGPMGTISISTYDVGQYRAPQNPTEAALYQGSIAYDSNMGPAMYQAFSNDILCSNWNKGNTDPNTSIEDPVSYCNLSITDSASENSRRWSNSYHIVSAQQSIEDFDGKYQLALPLAASATEWASVEVWNPDFTLTAQSPSVQNKTAYVADVTASNSCKTNNIDNAFFATNAQALNDPNSTASKQLADCLMSNQSVNGVPVQSYQPCGNGIPYSQCILISSLPGSSSAAGISTVQGNEADYDKANIAVYKDTNAQHMTGYAIFALETAAIPMSSHGLFMFKTNPDGQRVPVNTTPNLFIGEPWSLGFTGSEVSIDQNDPYYNTPAGNPQTLWQSFGSVIDESTNAGN